MFDELTEDEKKAIEELKVAEAEAKQRAEQQAKEQAELDKTLDKLKRKEGERDAVEKEKREAAKQKLEKAKEQGENIKLPVDTRPTRRYLDRTLADEAFGRRRGGAQTGDEAFSAPRGRGGSERYPGRDAGEKTQYRGD